MTVWPTSEPWVLVAPSSYQGFRSKDDHDEDGYTQTQLVKLAATLFSATVLAAAYGTNASEDAKFQVTSEAPWQSEDATDELRSAGYDVEFVIALRSVSGDEHRPGTVLGDAGSVADVFAELGESLEVVIVVDHSEAFRSASGTSSHVSWLKAGGQM